MASFAAMATNRKKDNEDDEKHNIADPGIRFSPSIDNESRVCGIFTGGSHPPLGTPMIKKIVRSRTWAAAAVEHDGKLV